MIYVLQPLSEFYLPLTKNNMYWFWCSPLHMSKTKEFFFYAMRNLFYSFIKSTPSSFFYDLLTTKPWLIPHFHKHTDCIPLASTEIHWRKVSEGNLQNTFQITCGTFFTKHHLCAIFSTTGSLSFVSLFLFSLFQQLIVHFCYWQAKIK